jgi:prepilin-type N-terminal cleavage/methylation domain-containing protein
VRIIDKRKAFTLVELLVVIAIIAALTATVFVSVDPGKRLRDARNARRVTDANTILDAVQTFMVDSNGSIPAGVGGTYAQIGTCVGGGGSTLCAMLSATQPCVNIGATLSSNKYIKSNPTDPQYGNAVTTGYAIVKDTNNVYTVYACMSEGTTISVSR